MPQAVFFAAAVEAGSFAAEVGSFVAVTGTFADAGLAAEEVGKQAWLVVEAGTEQH